MLILKHYDLVKVEKLQIINFLPNSTPLLSPVKIFYIHIALASVSFRHV